MPSPVHATPPAQVSGDVASETYPLPRASAGRRWQRGRDDAAADCKPPSLRLSGGKQRKSAEGWFTNQLFQHLFPRATPDHLIPTEGRFALHRFLNHDWSSGA